MKLFDAVQKADAAKRKTAKKAGPDRKAVVAAVREAVTQLEAAGPTVRLIFPCPKGLADRITAYWHQHRLKSKSEAIRALLEKGLGS